MYNDSIMRASVVWVFCIDSDFRYDVRLINGVDDKINTWFADAVEMMIRGAFGLGLADHKVTFLAEFYKFSIICSGLKSMWICIDVSHPQNIVVDTEFL